MDLIGEKGRVLIPDWKFANEGPKMMGSLLWRMVINKLRQNSIHSSIREIRTKIAGLYVKDTSGKEQEIENSDEHEYDVPTVLIVKESGLKKIKVLIEYEFEVGKYVQIRDLWEEIIKKYDVHNAKLFKKGDSNGVDIKTQKQIEDASNIERIIAPKY
ncbi:hypothetical protein Ddc_12765 [Ditylenchus destructor]|nr:hypothetical protein Ddc_12765 [Ditylenchus destructor]